jgi:hypothetical protein
MESSSSASRRHSVRRHGRESVVGDDGVRRHGREPAVGDDRVRRVRGSDGGLRVRKRSYRAIVPAGLAVLAVLAPAVSAAAGQRAAARDPFADEVVLFEPGTNAGFGQDGMPGIVLGPPQGGGLLKQSLDVVSLGNDGRIVVGFDDPVICDGPGVDFTVFENAFHAGTEDGPIFAEAGIVAVSQDGQTFFELPYDAETLAGLAGLTPVLSNPDNGIDPTDPAVSGGDSFDLATVGLAWAAYVKITDPGASIDDPGNLVPPGTQGGFDLDAMAIVNPCDLPPTTLPPGSTSTTTTTLPAGGTSTTVTSTTSTTLSGEPVCGDGIVDGDEQCDDGDAVWQPGQTCAADCTTVACGDPDDSGTHTATDALMALRAAVGTAVCDPCVCDVDGGVAGGVILGGGVTADSSVSRLVDGGDVEGRALDGGAAADVIVDGAGTTDAVASRVDDGTGVEGRALANGASGRGAVTRAGITASDALRLLRFATGIAGIELACPPCQ